VSAVPVVGIVADAGELPRLSAGSLTSQAVGGELLGLLTFRVMTGDVFLIYAG
jgi:hypothetical protein